MIMFGSFFPSLLVGWHHQSLLGSREPTLSWNQLHSERLFLYLRYGAQGQDHRYANCGEAPPRQPLILKRLASSFLNDGFGQYGTHKEKQGSYEDNDLPWVHVGSVARQLAINRDYTHNPSVASCLERCSTGQDSR
jgi:hypothetical protein